MTTARQSAAWSDTVVGRLWLWFWHLIPANPILLRVVHGSSRRTRDLWFRMGYLGTLLAVVLFVLFGKMSGEQSSLAELAKGASQTFALASVTQLAMICFLAPVFTAAAITQERDAQTFNILIATPLSNAQIVFGSLLSRLFFVITLLVSGLPIFLMTMVYGGVTASQVMESFALAGSTGVVTGALAILVSMVRVGSRRTIFSFFLLIALYMLTVYLLGRWEGTWVAEAPPASVTGQQMSWLTPVHPFLALDVALARVPAPRLSDLAGSGYSSLAQYALAYPAAAYVTWTLLASLLMTTAAVIFVRRGTKTGESTFFSRLTERLFPSRAERLTRPPRNVWSNPVAWREAKTRAASGGWLRWLLALAGLVAALVLLFQHLVGDLSPAEASKYLSLLVVIQFAITLLIATNAAATAMTKEKDTKAMDLLLTTMLTSRYILWGKLRGLVSFALPVIVGPVLALVLFGIYGMFSKQQPPAVFMEACLETAALMIVYCALACVMGLQISLSARKSMTAVMYSVALLIVLCGIATTVGMALVGNAGGEVGAFFAPFTPFTGLLYLIDVGGLYEKPAQFATRAPQARVLALLGSSLAVGLYTAVIFSMYRPLVRNFDMIMRKQSGT